MTVTVIPDLLKTALSDEAALNVVFLKDHVFSGLTLGLLLILPNC